MDFKFKGKTFDIARYPESDNRSLRPWSAADELMLSYIADTKLLQKHITIYNDRFGFLTTVLNKLDTLSVIGYKSQEKALAGNLLANEAHIAFDRMVQPLGEIKKPADLVLFKVPKSLDLFRMQIAQCAAQLNPDGEVVCGFMTRHFTKQLVEIAQEYFETAEQSQAVKKARLMTLRGPKKGKFEMQLIDIPFGDDIVLKQYPGVFSSKNVDHATRYLLEHLQLKEGEQKVLDLACGNGIIGKVLKQANPELELHLLDDSALAMESARLNFVDDNVFYHYKDSLDEFDDLSYDLIVTNPPFHFEYETNIEVSLQLFKDAHRVLAFEGRLLIVANVHLNYATHLNKIFSRVQPLADNGKYIIYQCIK